MQQVKMAGAMLVVVGTPQMLSREQESGCEFSGSRERRNEKGKSQREGEMAEGRLVTEERGADGFFMKET